MAALLLVFVLVLVLVTVKVAETVAVASKGQSETRNGVASLTLREFMQVRDACMDLLSQTPGRRGTGLPYSHHAAMVADITYKWVVGLEVDARLYAAVAYAHDVWEDLGIDPWTFLDSLGLAQSSWAEKFCIAVMRCTKLKELEGSGFDTSRFDSSVPYRQGILSNAIASVAKSADTIANLRDAKHWTEEEWAADGGRDAAWAARIGKGRKYAAEYQEAIDSLGLDIDVKTDILKAIENLEVVIASKTNC